MVPVRSQACVICLRHTSLQGPPPSYMGGHGEVTSCSCTMQRVSPTSLHVVVPQASRDATNIPSRTTVFNEPPSAGCRSGSELATSMRGQSQPR